MKALFVVDTIEPVSAAPAVRILSFAKRFSDPPADVLGGSLSEDSTIDTAVHRVRRQPVSRGFRFALVWLGFFRALSRKLNELARTHEFDVIMLSVPKFELLANAAAVRPYCRILVVDIRDSLGFVDYARHLGRFMPIRIAERLAGLIRRNARKRMQNALELADLITVANTGIAAELQEWSTKVEVIANGVDTGTFNPAAVKPTKTDTDSPLELVYMGNFAEKDQFEWILNTLPEQGESVRLNLLGDGREREKLVTALSRRGIPFRDFGMIEHQEIPGILASMDVGILLRDSFAEASVPVAFFEFASMNLPTICNDTGIGAEFVRKYGLGYVVSSERELADRLAELSAHRQLLDNFDQLHTMARAKFSRAAQADKLMRICNRLLTNSTRSPNG